MGLWVDPYTGQGLTEENPIAQLKGDRECAAVWGTDFVTSRCNGELACGYCELEQNENKFMIKGLCQSNFVNNDYDNYYYIHGLKNGKLFFKGIRYSYIYFDSVMERWILQSIR